MSATQAITYKRDQVLRALAVIADRWDPDEDKPADHFHADLKRLLGIDRDQANALHPRISERYAFHSAPPPGRGTDVAFTAYEAFALLIGLRILHSGVPQRRTVDFMRRVRPVLEPYWAANLRTDPRQLRPRLSEAELDPLVRDGILVQDVEKMIFLTMFGGEAAEPIEVASSTPGLGSGNICADFDTLAHRLRDASHQGRALIAIELVNASAQLHWHLSRVPLRSRGRS